MNKYLSKLALSSIFLILGGLGINHAYAAISPPVLSTATAGNAQVTLTWSAVTGATKYYISYSVTAGGTSNPALIVGNVTTGAVTGLTNGTTYTFIVYAANTSGTSVASNALNATPVLPSTFPVITAQPVNTTVTEPATATFKVTATASTGLTYQWKQSVSGGPLTAISGATNASYTTPATTLANNGTLYQCVVTDAAGSVTTSVVTLTVYSTPVAPAITLQPSNVTVTAPSGTSFSVAATGMPPPTYQWMQSVSGGAFTPINTATSSSYLIGPTTIAMNGVKYECVITNSSGTVTSNVVTLTVNAPVAPTITSQPMNTAVITPEPVTFTVTATGTPAPTYQWMQKAPLAGTFTTITNVKSSSYKISATSTALNGMEYECIVSNIAGSVTSNAATLMVSNPTPAISIVSPGNESVLKTGSIDITAIASVEYGSITNVAFYNGTTLLGKVFSTSQAFTYQWTNIPAGTYDLTAVATGNYGGTATSSTVTITINAATFTTAIDDNILTKTDARGHPTSFQYDKLNRLVKTTFADGSTVSFTYDLFGNQTKVTDQRGNVLTKTYDAYERLSQTKDPLGNITKFAYDTNGDLLTLTDANGNPTTYTYDDDYRVLTQSNALNDTTTFTYDPVGNVASREDADGKTTNYTYDALNRLTNISYPDSTAVVNVYDALGRKTSMTDATGQTTYTYDALSRLLTKTDPAANAITYTYDGEGNRLTSVDQTNRTITNTYNALNRLATVMDPNGTTTYGYDADSDEVSVTNPNGVSENYTYDDLNRVLTDVNKKGSTVITSFSNVYDIAGMITKKTLQDGSWTAYSYDALNRLLEETKQTSSAVTYDYVYTYDPVGNRMTWTKNTTLGGFWNVDYLNMPPQVLTNMTNGGYGNTANPTQAVNLARNYTYDAANRLSNWNYAVNIYSATYPVQTDTYTYDDNGNRLSKKALLTGETATPQQTSYAYDFENRLNQLKYTNIPNITGTQTDALTYNGEGLRTQAVLNSKATKYLYDGFNVLVEQNVTGNTTKTYTRGLDVGGGIGSIIAQNIPGTTPVVQYYDYNDLGSTANLTASTGAIADSYSYDAFGNLLTPQASGDTNRYLFSTKEFDSRSGLDYFGARYYDPEIGRWLTADPLGFVNGPNLYAYVGNNPVNLVDPYGLFGVFPDGTPSLGLPGFGGESGGFNMPGFTGANGPTNIPGLPDEFGPINIPVFPDGAPDLGGKENANSINNNGDVFSDGGGDGDGDTNEDKRNTPDQEALIDLAQDAKNTGISEEDAQTLIEWAQEYEVNPFTPEPDIHPNRNFNKRHIRIGPVNHIEVD